MVRSNSAVVAPAYRGLGIFQRLSKHTLARASELREVSGLIFPDAPRFFNPPSMPQELRAALWPVCASRFPARRGLALSKTESYFIDFDGHKLAYRTACSGAALVVLNGNGTPGIGQQVARMLVPEGYVLVASQNASEFGVNVTKIIASDREDLPAARKARYVLGVGQVFLGNQASGVADVTVVVGLDFGGP
jgi:hypothetical protein